jgi:type II secretory pathway pseudopilin PulG
VLHSQRPTLFSNQNNSNIWKRRAPLIAIHAALRRSHRDEGMGILEVVIAMAIFMIVALGVAYSAVSTLRLSSDSKNRVVATNLAASEIDNARANGDPLTLFANTRTVKVDGIDYTVARKVEWIDSTGAGTGCTGTGALQYKAVDVQVSWPGKLAMTKAVRSNTLIAPVTRINDPAFGTILVSVLGAAGTGIASIPITVTQVSTGAPVVMSDTDKDGCSYAFGVTPGKYAVTLKKDKYISDAQVVQPKSETFEVKAGSTVSRPFQYDNQARFNLTMASNSTLTGRLYPSNLDTTFISTYGIALFSTPVGGSNAATVDAHPFTSGYTGFAGAFSLPKDATATTTATFGCASPDPASWTAGTTVSGVTVKAAERGAAAAALPGGNVAMNVPMGTVTFTYTGTKDRYLIAKSSAAATGSGIPDCADGLTYRFGTKLQSGTTYKVALPYGTWSLNVNTQSNGGGTAAALNDNLAGVGGLVNPPVKNTVTLDPRVAP